MKKLLGLPGNFYFSAPTNKASKVLADFIGQQVKTTYSLLGLKMTAEADQLKLKAASNLPDLGKKPILVIDEAGMIPTFMSEMLVKQASEGWRIMFVGDPAQLNPVGEPRSPVWKLAHPEHNVIMREVKRFDNQLLKLSVLLRDALRTKTYDVDIQADNDGREGVFVESQYEFVQQIKSLKLADWQNTKVVCWRNKTVDSYNNIIRKSLGFDSRFCKGEILLMGEPIVNEGNLLAHTDEEVEVLSVDNRIFNFPEGSLDAWCLSLRGKSYKLYVPKDAGVLESYLAKRAAAAHEVVGGARKKAWQYFWELKTTFQTVRYGYAMTCHRLQGSTLNTVYVDQADILANRNKAEAYRCLYVAATRPTTKLITF
jgi:ATP-dependent exoDNAse (exonuclease V) alpha subunit